eukprot:15457597-Alexandrium_andersonii.AAC.1
MQQRFARDVRAGLARPGRPACYFPTGRPPAGGGGSSRQKTSATPSILPPPLPGNPRFQQTTLSAM